MITSLRKWTNLRNLKVTAKLPPTLYGFYSRGRRISNWTRKKQIIECPGKSFDAWIERYPIQMPYRTALRVGRRVRILEGYREAYPGAPTCNYCYSPTILFFDFIATCYFFCVNYLYYLLLLFFSSLFQHGFQYCISFSYSDCYASWAKDLSEVAPHKIGVRSAYTPPPQTPLWDYNGYIVVAHLSRKQEKYKKYT